jgi:O-antigen/teichoic acid export membrane protein
LEDLKEKTVTGVKWSAIGQFGVQGSTMLGSIILARLLAPNEFGLMAMITVLVGFANVFTNFGFGSALVQKKEISNLDLSSVFWVNVVIGILLTVLFIVLAPVFAWFYNEPSLKPLTILISFNFIFSSLNIVQGAILSRNMDFRSSALISIVAIVISFSVGLFLAIKGFGVWSLAWQGIINNFLNTLLHWFVSPWRPQRIFDKNAIIGMSRFSFHLFALGVFEYISANIDSVLIGKYLNKKQLGEYNRAFAFLMLPVINISSVLARVIMPSLSKIQDEKNKVSEAYFMASGMLTLIVFPMMIGLCIVADPLVKVVFGVKWMDMIPMVQIFTIIGIVSSLNALNDSVVISQGKTNLLFKLAPYEKTTLIAGSFIGLYWGVYGVIIAKALSLLFFTVPKFIILGKSIEVSLSTIIKRLIPSLSMAVGMGLILLMVKYLFEIRMLSDLQKLISLIFAGVGIYIILIFSFKREIVGDLKRLLIKTS